MNGKTYGEMLLGTTKAESADLIVRAAQVNKDGVIGMVNILHSIHDAGCPEDVSYLANQAIANYVMAQTMVNEVFRRLGHEF